MSTVNLSLHLMQIRACFHEMCTMLLPYIFCPLKYLLAAYLLPDLVTTLEIHSLDKQKICKFRWLIYHHLACMHEWLIYHHLHVCMNCTCMLNISITRQGLKCVDLPHCSIYKAVLQDNNLLNVQNKTALERSYPISKIHKDDKFVPINFPADMFKQRVSLSQTAENISQISVSPLRRQNKHVIIPEH